MKLLSKDKKPRLYIAHCVRTENDRQFVLAGETEIGAVHELTLTDEGLERGFALVEVTDKDVIGEFPAKTIWVAPWHLWHPRSEIYVYPNVRVRSRVTRKAIESYMKAEGAVSDLAHVVQDNDLTFMAYRRERVRFAWVCYCLDSKTGEYTQVYEAERLVQIKQWLVDKLPTKNKVIKQWGTEGATVWNVLDHGAVGSNTGDSTDAIKRIIAKAKTGDVVYIPFGHKIRVNEQITIPEGLHMDYYVEQVIVDGKPSSGK